MDYMINKNMVHAHGSLPLSFHCICKNRERQHYMAHSWIPEQTLVMHVTFHWANLNSFTDVNIGATI